MTPNDTAVKGGRSPQLPLEAAIALGDSGFPESRRDALSKRCATSGRPAANRPVKNGSFDPTISPHLQTQRASDFERLIADIRRSSHALPGDTPAGLQLRLRRLRASWRASRNGRRMSMKRRRHEPRNSKSYPPTLSTAHRPSAERRRRSAMFRPGSTPTPAPARRTF